MTIPIVRDSEISITESEWECLNFKYSQSELIQILSDSIEKIPFPYRKISLNESLEDFKALQNLDSAKLIKNNSVFTKYPYKYEMTGQYIDLSNVGNKASDYFHHQNRYKCDSLNAPSPVRVWETEKFRMNALKTLWAWKIPTSKLDSAKLRSALSLRGYTASQFRPSAAKAIYELFGSKDVIDFSSGWGDRLAGFYSIEKTKTYISTDPNTNLYSGYEAQQYHYGNNKTCICTPLGAEHITYDRQVDTVFTSPPYFDIERYTQENNQSWKNYKKLDVWLEKFLYVAVEKSWKCLKPNGIMAINIADVYGHHTVNKICDPLNDFISTLDGATYQGGLGYRMAKRPNSGADKQGVYVEPIWIWRKNL